MRSRKIDEQGDSTVRTRQPARGTRGSFIGFNSAVDKKSIDELLMLCGQAVRVGVPEVTICMSSTGGALDAAFYGYNLLEALPLKIITHNVGTVQSAALLIFVCGDERYAAPGTTFFFHDPAFEAKAQRLTGPALNKKLRAIEEEIARSATILAEKINRSEQRIKGWQTAETLMDGATAVKAGVIKRVRPLSMPQGAFFQQVTG